MLSAFTVDTVSAGARPVGPVMPAHRTGVAALVDHDKPWGNTHDRASRDTLLARIAALLGVAALDGVDIPEAAAGRMLLIPGDTIARDVADRAGIATADRILGGVVPAAFVGTKAITHGLVHAAARRPALWSTAMADLLGDAALNGYTAFDHDDAMAAGRLLLAHGPVRIKDVCARAGLGQRVVHDAAALADALAGQDPDDLARDGIVLEENLTDVVTYSVGTVDLDGRTISYWGSQSLTTDHQGRDVYGGSDLAVVRGGFDRLAAQPLPDVIARAVACAERFDRAAQLAYPDMILTRRNYDVIAGTDAAGIRRVGVLEQSWRVGGASGAEIAAFEAFHNEPDTDAVRCATIEIYARITPPAEATVYFCGDDPDVGAMTKYAMRLA